MIGALFIIAYAAGAWMILEEYIKETLWHAKVRKTLDEAGKKIKVVFAWRRSSSSDDELYKSCVLLKNLVIVDAVFQICEPRAFGNRPEPHRERANIRSIIVFLNVLAGTGNGD